MLSTKMDDCVGCGACENICPAKAISMQENKEGFLYPVVDADLCVSCDKCNKACPVQKDYTKAVASTAYAAWNKDDEVLQGSSSGGVFSILAQYVLNKGGLVCGAALVEGNVVKHILIENADDLEKLRGSKYVQSETGTVFAQIKNLLKSGQQVLFSGTPCQVAGLNSYLGKEFDNLLTVDVACHGVPSPKVWRKYVSELGNDISQVNFRDKAGGWKKFCFSYLAEGKKTCMPATENIFFKGFLRNLFLRKNCGSCRFANMNRPGDFTLADFWGIQKLNKKLDNFQGTSLVLSNTPKAELVLRECQDSFAKLQKVALEKAVRKNKVLYQPLKANPARDIFFSEFAGQNISELTAAKLYKDEYHQLLNNKADDKKVGIMNFHYSNTNFGAVMVPYALSTILKKYGYHPEIINFIPKFKEDKNGVFETFREKYLSRTFICRSLKDLEIVSKNFCRFVTGSDQVFRWHRNGKYLFNYVSGLANIISYAGSFGKDRYEGKDISYVAELFKRFDAVSVREKSGVGILKEKFGTDAAWVLDPTLLLDSSDYERIIENEQVITPDKKYIGYMFLNNSIKEDSFVRLQDKYELVNCLKTNGKFHSVAQWLNYIKNCDYFITDSFHGCVFATIFRKQFVCISRKKGGNSRLESLFERLGINPKRFYSEISDIDMNSFDEKIDYETVEKRLQTAKAESLDYLLSSLRRPLTYKQRLNLPFEHEFTYSFCGIPFLSRKIREYSVIYKLFGFLPILSRYPSKKNAVYKLFGILKFMTAKEIKDCRVYKLFGFLPVFKIKSAY